MSDNPRSQTHEEFVQRSEILVSSDRKFGFTMGIVLLILGLFPLLRAERVKPVPSLVGVLFCAFAWFVPSVLHPLNRFWTWVGLTLGRIVNPIVLGLLYFLVVTPIGLAARLFGKDWLRLRRDARLSTYWIERLPPGPPPNSMIDQF